MSSDPKLQYHVTKNFCKNIIIIIYPGIHFSLERPLGQVSLWVTMFIPLYIFFFAPTTPPPPLCMRQQNTKYSCKNTEIVNIYIFVVFVGSFVSTAV